MFDEARRREFLIDILEMPDEFCENIYSNDLRTELWNFVHTLHGPEKRNVPSSSKILQSFQGFRPDFSWRCVDDAEQTHAVVWIMNHTQIGHDVLDFLAEVKFDTSHDFVGNAIAHEGLFQSTRLSIGTVQYRKFTVIWALMLASVLEDGLGHFHGLVALIASGPNAEFFAPFTFGPETLFFAVSVAFNHGMGRVQNHRSGAVVLLEFDGQGLGIIFFKVENVLHVGPAPGVNTLVGITDHTKIAVFGCEQFYQHVLGVIGILILVYGNVAVALLVVV